jgi:deoxyribodipyrimidine photo-lyase
MRELNATGWMSNRGRQNVASFLAKDMEIDWRLGAEYFEMMLIDYDVTSNWGNWQYASGVGSDPRDRIFNVVKQGYDYDENGDYVRMWVPEVDKVTLKYVHCPFMMSMNEQKRVNCLIGADYPDPIVKAKTSWNPSEPRKPNKFALNAKNSRNK